ncbi:MAG: KdsC family phosphatase [Marinilabiliaceae bacterium]
MEKNFKELLPGVRAFAFDIDGVLSTQTVPMSADGIPMRTANIKDGYVLQLAVKLGYKIAIITGGKSDAIRKRYEGLGITDIYMGQATKTGAYTEWKEANGLKDEEILYMGDDIPDLPLLRVVGVPTCPQDACVDVKAACRYISPFRGGECCVRDVVEQVLRSKGEWGHDHSW